MLAALLPLIPLLTPLIPRLAEWIGGDDAEDVARQVTGVVSAVAGNTDPATVAAVLADPQRGGELAQQLARIAADRAKADRDADIAEITARLADVADARRQTVALATAGHWMAWMPAVVTVGCFVVFVWTLHALFAGSLAAENRELSLILVGAVQSVFTGAVAYWIGSSNGSAQKDQRLGQLTAASVSPRPFAGG